MSRGWRWSGRPNAGKSTLFNRLVGEERSIVHDQPGTTRDAVDTVIETPDGTFCFIDTAGMRRPSRTDYGTEHHSVLRALDALDGADIALLVIDATVGATHQDQRLAERVGAAGCPSVVVLNKWDLVAPAERDDVLAGVGDRLAFLGDAPVIRISAQIGPQRAQGAAGAARGGRGLPHPDPYRRAQPGLARTSRPNTPPPGPHPLRRPGRGRPAHLHPVRERPDAGRLPALRGEPAPGALRPRTDPDQAARPHRRTLSGRHGVVRRVRPAGRGRPARRARAAARPAAPCSPRPSTRRIPWTFKTMLVAFVIYLGYRGYQGITWIIHHV